MYSTREIQKERLAMETIKKQSKPSPMRLAVGACSLVLMLSCAHAGLAQQGARNHSAANQPTITATGATAHLAAQKAAEEEEETAKPAKPRSEGIKIHGHWVIDVRNPDGTLAAHRDFHNSLVTLTGASYGPTGDQILAALLSGNTVPGDPAILFVSGNVSANSDPSTYCQVGGGNQLRCYPFGNASNLSLVYSSAGTTYLSAEVGLTARVSFSPAVNWVLTGNYTVPNTLTAINAVQTSVPMCVAELPLLFVNGGSSFTGSVANRTSIASPSSCTSSYFDNNPANNIVNVIVPATLTSTILASPLTNLAAGQVITVTVTITFS
jgi:hypothetical protein